MLFLGAKIARLLGKAGEKFAYENPQDENPRDENPQDENPRDENPRATAPPQKQA